MELLRESITLVNARLRVFRLAFGLPYDDHLVPAAEFAALLPQVGTNARISHHLSAPDMIPQAQVQAVALVLMCLETALPFGGTVEIAAREHQSDASSHIRWQINAKSDRLQWDNSRWLPLLHGDPPEVSARDVQFALLPGALKRLHRTLDFERGEDWVRLAF
nr:histidine phosphotransferase family protein [Thalassobius sp. Cn5-15]